MRLDIAEERVQIHMIVRMYSNNFSAIVNVKTQSYLAHDATKRLPYF